MEVFDYLHPDQSLLGVCLGHQALGTYFKADLKQAERVFHGVSSSVYVDASSPLFHGLPAQIDVGRYHSWFVDLSEDRPQDLEVIARDEDGNIMGIQSKTNSFYGVQFHPESILCPRGKEIIQNWIKLQPK
jgi:anthranilate synthase component 2